jgi:hypothetical protein
LSGLRRAFLDRSPGEERAVVTLDGRPERLLIAWEDDATPRLGARYAGRVTAVSERMGLARVDLGPAQGSLRLRAGARPHVGSRLLLEVVAEPARGKPAQLRALDGDPGPGGLTAPPPPLAEQLRGLGLGDPVLGDEAREAADEAQALALSPVHLLAAGLDLAIETTRALTAVDVDLAEGAMAVARANLLAIGEAARLLRLKSQGGLIVVDLVGAPKAPAPLVAAARTAFAPDGAAVAIAPVSRFGVMEIAKPHAAQPLAERLLDEGGRPGARTLAQETVRALERQGRHAPGALLLARRQPEIARLAAPLAARLGPRYRVEADPGVSRESADIQAR